MTRPSPWQADCGDGTYRNPVLFADYSDPDATRVGDDFWMTSSSFGHAPGLPILHSRDLVNWTLVNHALPRLVPVDHFSQPRHGQGVWAPSIRYHAGKYWIFYPDPDFGLYVITATDPRGAWSEPHLLKAGKGLIDPCPLWDDDGNAYFVHAWAKSRAGKCNIVTLHRMSSDGRTVLDEGKLIIDGAQLPGWHTIEGPKLYKRDGYYYVFAPAGGVAEGYQAVFRAKDINGPYEPRVVLAQGNSRVNGPHQGAWVDTVAGEHWFFHFQELPAYGRVVHLQPMRWREDGWPVIGDDPDGDGTGEPVEVYPKPNLRSAPIASPATSDDFSGPALGLQWQWQGNPRREWWNFKQGRQGLTLACVSFAGKTSHWSAPHLLMQKFPAPAFSATTRVEFTPSRRGDLAGLIVFGYNYAWLGWKYDGVQARLVLVSCTEAQKGTAESELASVELAVQPIHLRVEVQDRARYRFSYSVDGAIFRPIGNELHATSSHWVGAKVGIFASATEESPSTGHATYTTFEVTP